MSGFSSRFFGKIKNVNIVSLIAVSALTLFSLIASIYLHSNNQANFESRKLENLQFLEKTANATIKDIVAANIRLKNHTYHVADKAVLLTELDQNQTDLFKRFSNFETLLEHSSIAKPGFAFNTQVLTHKAFINDLTQRYEILGADKTLGLRGRMDLIAKRITAELAFFEHPKLATELDLIKQHTESFIASDDKQFIQSLEQGLGRFNRLLGMAQTIDHRKLKTYHLSQSYKKTFHKYVVALDEFQNQIKQHDVIYQSLLSDIIGISNLAVSKIAQTKIAISHINQRISLFQIILIILTISLLAGAGIMVVHSVIMPLAKISNIHDVLVRNNAPFEQFNQPYGKALPNTT